MNARVLWAAAILAVAPAAHAAWDIGAGLENYTWTEQIPGFSSPKENGMRAALFVNWAQDKDQGLLFTWRGKFYAGTVNYETFNITTGAPVSTNTEYSGAANEAQLVYRDDLGGHKLDYLCSLGLDYWRRSIRNIGFDQIEDFSVIFARAGLRFTKSGNQPGFHGEGGLKYPVSIREDAHLTSLGYTSNPMISPKGAVSAYAELGYRINDTLDVLGYYDSWRFRRSDDVIVNDTQGNTWGVHQPKSSMDSLGIKLLISF